MFMQFVILVPDWTRSFLLGDIYPEINASIYNDLVTCRIALEYSVFINV